MYHLFISADENSWDGASFDLDRDRCIKEYTATDLAEQYADFTDKSIADLKKFPCIFAYEAFVKKDPRIGKIKDISKSGKKIVVNYTIDPTYTAITHDDLADKLKGVLDIDNWELNRTHWALKEVDLANALTAHGFQPPAWASRRKRPNIKSHVFDVALSFPGEQRPYVEQVAQFLEKTNGPDSYFYDNNYKAQLAQPNLDKLLEDLYRTRARLVVVFICAAYDKKEWCGIEFRAVRDIIKAKEDNKVMYIKCDSGKVMGVLSTDGYIDAQHHSPEEVAELIAERLEHLS